MQEARDSSAIENIVTTHDELFKDDVPEAFANAAVEEVLRYRQALRIGFERVHDSGLLTSNHVVEVQRELERNNAGIRTKYLDALAASGFLRTHKTGRGNDDINLVLNAILQPQAAP